MELLVLPDSQTHRAVCNLPHPRVLPGSQGPARHTAFHAAFPTPCEEGVMWSGALPKAGGPGGDRTRAQSRTCILSLTSCPPPLVTGTQYPPPNRGPGANPGANPGKGWPDWEASTQGGVAAAWQTPLPLPRSCQPLQFCCSSPGLWASLPLSWAHACRMPHAELAAGGWPCAPAPTQARSPWPVPVVSAWPPGF